MSGEEEDGYDPYKQQQINKQTTYKFHTTKCQLKKLKVADRSPSKLHSQEDQGQAKTRRAALQNKKDYYEQTSLQVNEQRAKKYWSGLDAIYFRPTNLDYLRDVVERILSPSEVYEVLENEYNLNECLLSFRDYAIYRQYPEIENQQSTLKILFEQEQRDSILAFYQVDDADWLAKTETNEDVVLGLVTKINVDPSLFQYNPPNPQQDQLEKELDEWQSLSERVRVDNRIEYEKLWDKVSVPDKKIMMSETQINAIKQKLYWSTILKLFIEGHKDKTSGIFQYYNIMGEDSDVEQAFKSKKEQKKFETDCKVCFCSSNYESNIVVYCDICNTSFHVICYGLKNIPKSQKFYCQVCTEFKLIENKDRPNCKICEKKYFPMKKMDKHYYHVTCLVLNNLIQFRGLELKLRREVNFKVISNIVINSEMKLGSCYYCESQYGFRFQCREAGCGTTFHPICGYLNGCIFEMKRSSYHPNNLDVTVCCVYHHPSRNYVEQVYFRRYVCDYKRTSQYSYQQFKLIYKREMDQYQTNNRRRQNPFHEILLVNKHMRQARNKLKVSKSKGKVRTQVSKLMKTSDY